MATRWLYAARYADTNGYQGDHERQMWRWRDWVIEAFNANMPFDQFTIEQIAGDLLPGATLGIFAFYAEIDRWLNPEVLTMRRTRRRHLIPSITASGPRRWTRAGG